MLSTALKQPTKIKSSNPTKKKVVEKKTENILPSLDQENLAQFEAKESPEGLISSEAAERPFSRPRRGSGDSIASGSQSAAMNDSSSVVGSVMAQDVELGTIDVSKTLEKDGIENEGLLDDGLSTLTADEYVKVRLVPIVARFTGKAPDLAKSSQVVTGSVRLCPLPMFY